MPFSRFRRALRASGLICGALAATYACERTVPAARTDSVVLPAERFSMAPTKEAGESGWNRLAGPVLLIQGETREEAIVLPPWDGDSASLDGLGRLGGESVNAVLFGRGGARFTAQLGARPPSLDRECRVWPLRAVHGEGAASSWAVGFVGGDVMSLALDSVDDLSSRDSMALVAEASRLASAVTTTTPPSFQGLRFTAHDIRRFEASPGVHALVAHLVRKVNQEANPQEEQTLLIAERDSGATTGPYQLVYADRSHGREEESVTPEVIAAVRVAGVATLVLARDSDAGVAYLLLERKGPRQWRVRWTSGMTRCG